MAGSPHRPRGDRRLRKVHPGPLLAERLGALLTFEPGATALGRRSAPCCSTGTSLRSDARAEALLLAADRAQHVAEVIAPALDAGRWVVTDRFSASTLAYQGTDGVSTATGSTGSSSGPPAGSRPT